VDFSVALRDENQSFSGEYLYYSISNLHAIRYRSRALQVTVAAGQGRARLQKFSQGRLQGMAVVTCQPAINFVHSIRSISFVKYTERKRTEVNCQSIRLVEQMSNRTESVANIFFIHITTKMYI
jgi:hypothetical protein